MHVDSDEDNFTESSDNEFEEFDHNMENSQSGIDIEDFNNNAARIMEERVVTPTPMFHDNEVSDGETDKSSCIIQFKNGLYKKRSRKSPRKRHDSCDSKATTVADVPQAQVGNDSKEERLAKKLTGYFLQNRLSV